MIGKLESVQLREIWKHEAYDFTTWLFENIDILGDQIGLPLTVVETEKSVGPFSVDILAEDVNGRPVIIENQLEKTNHDHLGKVLTYLSNLDAKIAIWISTNPRPEHVVAIDYLNEIVPQDTRFFLVKVQAFKIGDSTPAPLFTIEAGPSYERHAGGEMKKEFAEREQKRATFFQQLLDKCNEKTKLFSNVSPGCQQWITAGAGISGNGWQFVITKKAARVELFIASPDAATNKKRYENLFLHKTEIEEKFGSSLLWDLNEERKQQYVRVPIETGGLDDEEKWGEIQDALVDSLIRLEKALQNYLKI